MHSFEMPMILTNSMSFILRSCNKISRIFATYLGVIVICNIATGWLTNRAIEKIVITLFLTSELPITPKKGSGAVRSGDLGVQRKVEFLDINLFSNLRWSSAITGLDMFAVASTFWNQTLLKGIRFRRSSG